jgi:hypothetical protein
VTYLTKHNFHFTANGDVAGITGLGSLSKTLGSLGSGSQSVTLGLTGDITKLSGNSGQADVKATFSGSGTLVNLAQVFTNGKPVEIRVVANDTTTAVYLNIGQAIGGKNWMALSSAASSSGSPSSLEQSLGEIAWFGDAGDLKVVGTGANGTVELASTVTAQSASTAASTAAAAGNAAEATALRSIANDLGKAPGAALVSDFWVDPTSYAPAKATLTVTGVSYASKVNVTLTFSNFDESVNVPAPSASDTYTATQLGQLLGG